MSNRDKKGATHVERFDTSWLMIQGTTGLIAIVCVWPRRRTYQIGMMGC